MGDWQHQDPQYVDDVNSTFPFVENRTADAADLAPRYEQRAAIAYKNQLLTRTARK
jgi:hypothetical protein